MTRKKLYTLNFLEAVNQIAEERDDLTSYDTLKDFAKAKIDSDDIFVAIHILEALNKKQADYYNYDFCMGTLDTPTPIETLQDLADYCE